MGLMPITFRYKCEKKAFTKHAKKWENDVGKKSIEDDLNKIKKYACVVRIIANTQVCSQCMSQIVSSD